MPPHKPQANGMSGFINNLEQITQQMRQMFIQTSQPTIGQDMKQHSKPSLTSKIAIVQSMGLRGKKKKYKGKHTVNPSQTLEKYHSSIHGTYMK